MQVVGFEPGRAPDPEQASHATEVGSLIDAVLPSVRLFEGDFQIVAQVGAALAPRRLAAATAAHHVAEQVVEDVGHRRGEAVVHAALLERGVAVAIVSRALLRVRQMLVGLVEFLEASLGLLVAGMPVGMALHRRFAEG